MLEPPPVTAHSQVILIPHTESVVQKYLVCNIRITSTRDQSKNLYSVSPDSIVYKEIFSSDFTNASLI